MPHTREQVEALALTLFGSARMKDALALIDEYGTQPHEREVHRVHLAILEVSEGRMNRLPYFIQCAKIDYRDVLVGAKLPGMTEAEEARWQASADRMLAKWKNKG